MPVYNGYIEHHGPMIVEQLMAACPCELYLNVTYEKLVISETPVLVITGQESFSGRACYLNYFSWGEENQLCLTLTTDDAINLYRDPVRFKQFEKDNWSRPHNQQSELLKLYSRFLATSHQHPIRFNYYNIATAIIVWMQLGIQVEEL